MNDSSDNKKGAFDGLSLKNVIVLLDVLSQAKLSTRDYIQKRFLEQAQNFEETLTFLFEIGRVHEKNEELSLFLLISDPSSFAHNKSISEEILGEMIRTENHYQSETFKYLSRFEVRNGHATFLPAASGRSIESNVRNFLMELGVVSYDDASNCYTISPENNAVFAQAKNQPLNHISPSDFEASRKDKEDIGYAAELAILDYERNRLGPQFASKVDHVAAKNIAAGYDIQSVTISPIGKELPRYVEVKAVPSSIYRFFWSLNERNVAKTFGSWYFLYLLPVGKGGKLYLENLLIIEDPHTAILESPDKWAIEDNVLQCMLKTDTSKSESS